MPSPTLRHCYDTGLLGLLCTLEHEIIQASCSVVHFDQHPDLQLLAIHDCPFLEAPTTFYGKRLSTLATLHAQSLPRHTLATAIFTLPWSTRQLLVFIATRRRLNLDPL
ncbi:hypothetical protein CBOM_08006 [Ceraceosorus bombacis]|uniref:Uncharacterized protein n=1 Tax=Ceraceosorus bombacis TaxID=401625 RepID=A0A0P1BK09_9BASI|nr:hypothetical protein CBOM_08006 [Ceraceosorus bombacis]